MTSSPNYATSRLIKTKVLTGQSISSGDNYSQENPGTHKPRISVQTVTNRLREIGEISPIYNVCFICGVSFWPSI